MNTHTHTHHVLYESCILFLLLLTEFQLTTKNMECFVFALELSHNGSILNNANDNNTDKNKIVASSTNEVLFTL